MSIWRSHNCLKCGKHAFEVADNGLNSSIRMNCLNCEHEFYLVRRTSVNEFTDWERSNKHIK